MLACSWRAASRSHHALRCVSRPLAAPTQKKNSKSMDVPLPARRGYYATALGGGGRPPGMSARMWYRRDGTPRSKMKGLLVATLAGATLYTFWAMLSVIEELDSATYLFARLIRLQHVDLTAYAGTDFDAPGEALAYFRALCACFVDFPEHLMEEFFEDVRRLGEREREEVHRIVCAACEEVHRALGSIGAAPVRADEDDALGEDRDLWEVAEKVVRKIDETVVKLVEIVEDAFADDEEKVVRNRKIREQALKDPAAKSNDYEVVG